MTRLRQLGALAASHRALAAIFGAFAASAFIVPTLTPIALWDDWIYAKSVEILIQDAEVRILEGSVTTLVFHTFWGALFAKVFGMTFGVLRLSTVVLALIGAIALYGLTRELGVSRGKSALGTAVYLFNPLAYVLTFTFMTDVPFMALLVVATYLYVRALRTGAPTGTLVLASGVAACAFLVRQQGILIPLCVAAYLVLTGRMRPTREGLSTLLKIAAIPLAAAVVYYVWLTFWHGVPYWHGQFLRQALSSGRAYAATIFGRSIFTESVWMGVFALPLVVAALPSLAAVARSVRLGRATVFVVLGAIPVIGAVWFWPTGARMPYGSSWITTLGLGPVDLVGSRAPIVGGRVVDILTYLSVAAAVLYFFFVCIGWGRRESDATSPEGDARRFSAGIVVAILLGQVIGVLPPSFHFGFPLDRYLLPLLPLSLCLLLWALREVRLSTVAAWLFTAAMAILSIVGTRDFIVFEQGIWDLAGRATSQGISATQLDAGAGWTGWHLWDHSRSIGTPFWCCPDRPWWINLWGLANDGTYIISATPVPGYTVMDQVGYSAWLARQPTYLYLSRRE